MYTILTTYPAHTSGNVGDRLITQSAIEILKREKGETDFELIFRDESLEDRLDIINQSRAIIMPGFAIRDPMYPQVYKLVEDLNKLKIPLIPMGAGSKVFPGDFASVKSFKYSSRTIEFLKFIARQVDIFSCREYLTCKILGEHGINNTVMVGDCGWYDLDTLGRDMKRPDQVRKLVFTTPHNSTYTRQATLLIDMLSVLFPDAEKYCALQSVLSDDDGHESFIVKYAVSKGFEIREASHSLEKIDFYQDCDLHVGYRCHGHIAFLRKRIPSILIHEDSRGVGFSYTLGGGGWDAFSRPSGILPSFMEAFSSVKEGVRFAVGMKILGKQMNLNTFIDPQVAVNMSIIESIRDFLTEELKNGFRRYLGIPLLIDETYKQMQSFLKTIP